jgi:hypothetical protein
MILKLATAASALIQFVIQVEIRKLLDAESLRSCQSLNYSIVFATL